MKSVAAVLIVAGIAAPLSAQSLAEVAARDKERRAREGAKAKEYSDSDLKGSPSPGASPTSSPSPAASPSAPAAGAAGVPQRKGWRAPSTSPTPAPVPTGQAPPTVAPAADPNESARMAALETQWRAAAAQRRAALAQADATVAALREKVNALRNDMAPVNVMDPNREQTRQAAIGAAVAELESAEATRAAAQKAVDDLESDVRRAGGLPGWVR